MEFYPDWFSVHDRLNGRVSTFSRFLQVLGIFQKNISRQNLEIFLRERRGSNPSSRISTGQHVNQLRYSHKHQSVYHKGKVIARGLKYVSEERCHVAISIVSRKGATKTGLLKY